MYTAENMIESFLEPVLDLLAALIEFDHDALIARAPGALLAPAERALLHPQPCMGGHSGDLGSVTLVSHPLLHHPADTLDCCRPWPWHVLPAALLRQSVV